MRVAATVGAALIATVLVAGPVAAQGKDPFRPPAPSGTSGTIDGGTAGSGGMGSTIGPQPPAAGGLPRTGLDYSLPVLAAGALIAMGISMRMTSRALAP
jgi:opacity protein-like surface antigen